MRPDESDAVPNRSARRHEHPAEHAGRPAPAKRKTPLPTWNNKTMHHPATRIGEIKHGKA